MSTPFFTKHDFTLEYLDRTLAIVSPGKHMSSRLMVPNVGIKMGDYKFLSSPVVLGDSNIDLILGMD